MRRMKYSASCFLWMIGRMKKSFDHFDLLAPIYEFAIHPQLKEDFWKIVDVPDTGYLLDAGGGTGRVSQFIKNTNCHVTVTDLSLPMLYVARDKPLLTPVQSPTENLPFQSGTFDRIIMVDALHHMTDQGLTTRELWRVLKPGGLLVIEEPDISKFVVKLIALGEKMAFMHSHFLRAECILELFPFPMAIKTLMDCEDSIVIKIEKSIAIQE